MSLCYGRGYWRRLVIAGAGMLQMVVSSAAAAPLESHHYLRRYQATAYISVLSVRLFARSGVGFGYGKADEEVMVAGQREISLQFLSGSIPERAHGLNRFGFIQENVEEHNGSFSQANYLGLITANGEESLSQAKAALNNTAETMPFIAAQASVDSKGARFSIRHLMLSSTLRLAHAEQLLDQVHAAFQHSEEGQPEHNQALNGEVLNTFLYSVRAATLAKEQNVQKRFIYNGKIYRLQAEKREDGKVGLELQAAGLISQPSNATRLSGAIHNEKTNEVTNFHLWFDRTSPDWIPLRFDFRPKSYLRLVFQATK